MTIGATISPLWRSKLIRLGVRVRFIKGVAHMRKGKVTPIKKRHFERLVEKGIILKPESFSQDHKEQINSLTADEVEALISIRAKLGHEFIQQKVGGKAPSIAIVF